MTEPTPHEAPDATDAVQLAEHYLARAELELLGIHAQLALLNGRVWWVAMFLALILGILIGGVIAEYVVALLAVV